MKTKAFFLEFTVIFMITFVVASLVSYGWNYVTKGQGIFNWGIAFQFAIMLAIICPMLDMMKSGKNYPE